MVDFSILFLLLLIWMTPAVLFTAGASEISRWFWSREKAAAEREQHRADLYPIAGAVARHRLNGGR